jgi:hypothetical protein
MIDLTVREALSPKLKEFLSLCASYQLANSRFAEFIGDQDQRNMISGTRQKLEFKLLYEKLKLESMIATNEFAYALTKLSKEEAILAEKECERMSFSQAAGRLENYYETLKEIENLEHQISTVSNSVE